MGGMQFFKNVSIPLQRGAVCVRHSAAELLLYLKSCLPPTDLTHFMVSLRMSSVPVCPMGRGTPGDTGAVRFEEVIEQGERAKGNKEIKIGPNASIHVT